MEEFEQSIVTCSKDIVCSEAAITGWALVSDHGCK